MKLMYEAQIASSKHLHVLCCMMSCFMCSDKEVEVEYQAAFFEWVATSNLASVT